MPAARTAAPSSARSPSASAWEPFPAGCAPAPPPAAAPPCRTGQPCTAHADCCSGLCAKHGRKRKQLVCRPAPGQSVCTTGADVCRGVTPECQSDGLTCGCGVTAAGASFCLTTSSMACFACQTDKDSKQREGGTKTDRCLACSNCDETGGRACATACATACAKPLARSCDDGIRNGDETDKDCGGSCPRACTAGLRCLAGSDCTSGVCCLVAGSSTCCDVGETCGVDGCV